jgi:hypothetical protein
MADIVIGLDEYEISSANGRWRCCDLDNGFLVLISDVIDVNYITEVLTQSEFQPHEYNTVFKNQPNKSWCIRFMVGKHRESAIQTMLEKFNV